MAISRKQPRCLVGSTPFSARLRAATISGNGVYLAEAWICGVSYHGVINLGYRPTVSSGKSERVLEIHLLDFNRDIYGQDVEVRFVSYLRPERKFDSVEVLVQQIELDVRRARELCAT